MELSKDIDLTPINRVIECLDQPNQPPLNTTQRIQVLETVKQLVLYQSVMQAESSFITKLSDFVDQAENI